jgi:hypothetical protein
MPRGNINARIERLETLVPREPPEHREWMRKSLEGVAAWRRAGSSDNDEERYVQELLEAVERRRERGEG